MLLAKSEPFLLAFLRTAEVFAILVGGVFCGEEVSQRLLNRWTSQLDLECTTG